MSAKLDLIRRYPSLDGSDLLARFEAEIRALARIEWKVPPVSGDVGLELALRDWMSHPRDPQIDDDLRDAAETWLETHTRFELPPKPTAKSLSRDTL